MKRTCIASLYIQEIVTFFSPFSCTKVSYKNANIKIPFIRYFVVKKTSAKYSTPCIALKFIFVAFAPIEIQLIDSTRKINYEIIAAIELHKQLIATN